MNPLRFNRGYNRDPNIQALKRMGFINHGSALQGLEFWVRGVYGSCALGTLALWGLGVLIKDYMGDISRNSSVT